VGIDTPNLASVVKTAQKALAAAQAATSAPVVVWCGLDETPKRFAKRVAALRAQRTGRILAAVPYGFPVTEEVQGVQFPAKLFRLLHPDAPSRYRCASGGRGSGKSHSFAAALVLRALTGKIRILCAREIMRSLRESVHHLLTDKIDALGLTQFFDVNDRELTCKITGAEIIFAGLWANVSQLKSLEGVNLCWIEESESVSERSLETLAPTIRAAGSEIWLSCNPDARDAPIMQFVGGTRADTRHEHVIFSDNPFFPEALEGEREYLQRVDQDAYAHVWLGHCRVISDALIFRNKYFVEEFTPGEGWDGPYHGLDLGFSADPSVLTKCWVHENKLFVEKEAWGLHVDIDRLPLLLDEIPGASKYTIRVDSSRPETISYLKQHGYPDVVSVEKWPDSVADGIARMRAFEKIVIHPSCEHTVQEFRLYSYKTDRLTQDVLPDIIDKHNHCVDSLRYAIAPLIKSGGAPAFLAFLGNARAAQVERKAKLLKRPDATVRDLDLFGHRK
jgi:phage terminase large subunit